MADRIVNPPVQQTAVSVPDALGLSRDWMATGQGNRLAYWVVVPGAYALDNHYTRQSSRYSLDFKITQVQPPASISTRGTVLYLHGWGTDASSMLPWAIALSESGYRGIAVDLRHHGQSDPAPLGFGQREAQDLAQLIPRWREQGVIQGPLYLFGHSYGATTALLLAPLIPDQPATGVIAIAPYANAGQAVPRFIDATLHGPGMPALLHWWYDPVRVERGITEAQQRLQLVLSSVDATAAVATTQTCTLILHGARDGLIPPAQSASLGTGNPRVQHVLLPDDDHVSSLLRISWLRDPLAEWMVASAEGPACEPLRAGPDPAQPQVSASADK